MLSMRHVALHPRCHVCRLRMNVFMRECRCVPCVCRDASVKRNRQIRLLWLVLLHPFAVVRLFGTGGGGIRPSFFSSSAEGRLPYTEYTLW